MCIFCNIEEKSFLKNSLALAIWDAFPVTPLHALILPRRHAEDYFALTPEELLACDELLRQARALIQEQDPSVEGFNLGVNVGKAAGQTIFHCHIHLIPRRAGDLKDPRGGIRGVIPERRSYGETS
jgi:diadenosine tetraphosphate (Ap4A) HIT family hydrolase